MLLLLSCCIIAGIVAEDPAMHYGLKTSSVCLHVGKTQEHVNWRINNTLIVKNGLINLIYKEKVDYGNFSLCIKELTETDSGTYEAMLTQGFTSSTEYHRLIVQETVPRPVIRMKVLHSNQSAGSCHITVNCSVRDDWAWFVCDEARCRTSQRSFSTVNITISTGNRTIVCNGNNHVSTSNSSESVEGICFGETNTEYTGTLSPAIKMALFISPALLLLALLCVLTVYLAKKFYFSTKCDNQQVETAPQIERLSVEAQPQVAGHESSSCQAERVYENVEDTQHIRASNTTVTPEEGVGSEQPPKADTLYCFLKLPVATAPLAKRDNREDTRRHEKTREATATSEPEATSVYNKVKDEAQNQSRDNMSARERPKQPSESAAVQPVQTYPENLGSASLEETDDGDVLVRDVEAVQCHREARGNSVTLEETQHPTQADTVYSEVQKPRRPKHHQQAKQDSGGQRVNDDT